MFLFFFGQVLTFRSLCEVVLNERGMWACSFGVEFVSKVMQNNIFFPTYFRLIAHSWGHISASRADRAMILFATRG